MKKRHDKMRLEAGGILYAVLSVLFFLFAPAFAAAYVPPTPIGAALIGGTGSSFTTSAMNTLPSGSALPPFTICFVQDATTSTSAIASIKQDGVAMQLAYYFAQSTTRGWWAYYNWPQATSTSYVALQLNGGGTQTNLECGTFQNVDSTFPIQVTAFQSQQVASTTWNVLAFNGSQAVDIVAVMGAPAGQTGVAGLNATALIGSGTPNLLVDTSGYGPVSYGSFTWGATWSASGSGFGMYAMLNGYGSRLAVGDTLVSAQEQLNQSQTNIAYAAFVFFISMLAVIWLMRKH